MQAAGRHFRVSRCTYGDIDAVQQHVLVERDYCDGVIVAGRHRLDYFGPSLIRELKQGRTVVVCDDGRDPRTSASAAAFAGIQTRLAGVRAAGGRTASLSPFWCSIIATRGSGPPMMPPCSLEEIAERTWSAVEVPRPPKFSSERRAFPVGIGRRWLVISALGRRNRFGYLGTGRRDLDGLAGGRPTAMRYPSDEEDRKALPVGAIENAANIALNDDVDGRRSFRRGCRVGGRLRTVRRRRQ